MQVSLTPKLEKLVAEKLKSGLYQTASDVIREALRLLEERDSFYRLRLKTLRADVRKGLEQLDRGEGRPLDVARIKTQLRTVSNGKPRRKAR